MMCLNPVAIRNPLYYLDDKLEHKFDDNLVVPFTPTIYVRCGHCFYCRQHRASELSLKVKHEYSTCKNKAVFVTFTFNNEHVPQYHSDSDDELFNGYDFDKKPLQDFFKNLRRQIAYKHLSYKFKYIACGEYGSTTYRCHYHALLLGVSKAEIGSLIKKCWDKFGFTKIVDADANASRYVVKYMHKSECDDWYYSRYYSDLRDLLNKMMFTRLNTLCCPDKRNGKKVCPTRNLLLENEYFLKYAPYVDKVTYRPFYKGNYVLNSDRCLGCSVALDSYDFALALRRKIKDMFLRSRCIPFVWTSINLGKEYALSKASDLLRDGCIFDGNSKDNKPINRGIPETYKRYVLDYIVSKSDYYEPTVAWHDVCLVQRDWFKELERRMASPNWFMYDPENKYREGLLLDDIPEICQDYDSWLCERLLPKKEKALDNYWSRHKPKLH